MPAVAPAREALTAEELNRRLGQGLPTVQGIAETNADSIKLRNGEGLVVSLGAALRDEGAALQRSIDESTKLTLTAHDPKLELLNHSLLSSPELDVKLDGLWFRYAGSDLTGKTTTLTFIEREIALLKSLYGPVKARRSKTPGDGGVTRAQFIAALVGEARPRIPTFIPEVNVIQPVAKAAKTSTDENRDADAVRTPGFEGGGLTVKGVKPNAEQLQVATDAMTVADQYDAPFKARVVMFCALTQENNMTASTNDGPFAFLDSTAAALGVDQHDTKACAKLFLVDGIWDPPGSLPKLGAIEWVEREPNADPGYIAQQIEGSAHPTLYSQHAGEARKWVEAWGGSSGVDFGSVTTTTTEPYAFEVDEKEDYWTAIKRLAKQVNYRAFVTSGRFFYVAEPKLFAQKVRLAIVQEGGEILTPGVDDVAINYNGYLPVTTVTVSARAKYWACPPGTVVTVRGYGPASVGDYFSDPKLRKVGKDKKGKPLYAGLDRARPVVGRYIVSTVESGLFSKAATITLKKPTEPLPEPLPESTTTTTALPDAETGVSNDALTAMITEAERMDSLSQPYSWGGGHGGSTSKDGPWDCSGAVSRVMDVGGLLPGGTPVVSGAMAGMWESGAGDSVTIYANSEHVLMSLNGRFFGTSGSNPGGGAGWISDPDGGYLSAFTQRHPEGF